MYARYIKRPLDVMMSVCILGMFWWLYVLAAVLVRIFLGSPVIFRQVRPGKNMYGGGGG